MKLTQADYERIAERMFAEAADNVRNFEPEDTDYEWLFEKQFEAVAGEDYIESDYMAAYNSKPVQEVFDEIRTYIIEYWEDALNYQNPMAYYGLKQSDFI